MTAKPEILARETIARSRLFEVEQVDLRFANGREVRFEKLVSRGFGAVLVVPVTDSRSVLLVREYAVGVDRYEVSLPKGRVEPGEDMLAAANRELMEEVGVGARRMEPVTGLTLAPGYLGHVTEVILARDLDPQSLPGDEPEPPEVVEWPLDDLPGLLARDDCTEARTLAALYIVRDLIAGEETE
ncbi:MAG: ADP compounds hydrolase NudE [Halofilum sp. (in: g-proteobacteria)]|nr:ADP compounds hydrolase NudE [Halofilum sp. (in: g-proteobacteria)]